MNRLYETGIMLTLFIISINAFLVFLGPQLVGATIPTIDMNITATDVNNAISAGGSVTKSGEPFATVPSNIAKAQLGSDNILDRLGVFMFGYAIILNWLFPPGDVFSFLVQAVTAIFTAIQLVTITYFLWSKVSILFGGGVK